MNNSLTKQVLIVRRDLKMRRGKEVSQGGHGASMFMALLLREMLDGNFDNFYALSEAKKLWIKEKFTKITLAAPDEQTILDVQKAAQEAGIDTYLVTDSGFTEFHGVPTNTVLSLGPDFVEKIDAITGKNGLFPLPLY